jgi:hypothetical protein
MAVREGAPSYLQEVRLNDHYTQYRHSSAAVNQLDNEWLISIGCRSNAFDTNVNLATPNVQTFGRLL